MSSLANHLYNRAHGRIQTDTKVVDSETLSAAATPPSGKKLCVMKIHVFATRSDDAVDEALTITKYDGSSDTNLFVKLTYGSQMPVTLDLSSCPIILDVDETIRAKVEEDENGPLVNLTIHSFVLDG